MAARSDAEHEAVVPRFLRHQRIPGMFTKSVDQPLLAPSAGVSTGGLRNRSWQALTWSGFSELAGSPGSAGNAPSPASNVRVLLGALSARVDTHRRAWRDPPHLRQPECGI